MKVKLTIYGEPASKANQRRLAHVNDGKGGKRALFIKSKKALDYVRNALKQIPPTHRVAMEGAVRVTLHIFYASERPDLDESVILDVLQNRYVKDKASGERVLVQKGVYANDRQVREKHVYWGKDPGNPRAEIEVETMEVPIARTAPLFAAEPLGVPF